MTEIQLSKQTDSLDYLHMGSALGGLILLALPTNLPEIANALSAAALNNIGVAVGSILGGVAIQTVCFLRPGLRAVSGLYHVGRSVSGKTGTPV